MKVVPDAPAGPVSPCGPCGPVVPVSPFNPVNAKANVRAEAVPPSVTLTEGVPVEASTVADAPVMVASSPSSPAGPCGPVAPVAPVSPCGPVAPVSPVGPCGPTRSAELVPDALVTVRTVPFVDVQ